MLTITIPSTEMWDEANECFITTKEKTLVLEHSLVSISKWESKWKKPFLGDAEKTVEEFTDYIRCMTLTQNVDPEIYKFITPQIIKQVMDYIDDSMTASTVKDMNQSGRREVVTSELIYFWMVSFQIPFECQKWHFNRLIMLIRICNAKNQPSKKMPKAEALSRRRAQNNARKAKHHTRG